MSEFVGTLPECLAHYRQRFEDPNSKIADFCKSVTSTASGWGTAAPPKGRRLNRLWVFLYEHDIVVRDIKKLNPAVLYLNRLLAFDVLNLQEIKELLGINGHDQYTWKVLQGVINNTLIANGTVTLSSLQQRYAPDLEAALELASEAGQIVPPAKVAVAANSPSPQPVASAFVPASTPVATPSVAPADADVSMAAMLAASNLMAAWPYIYFLLNAGTEGGVELRKFIGEEQYHKLLDALKSMTSRKAREYYQGGPR